MTIGFIFWLLWLLALIFGWAWNWPADRTPAGFRPIGDRLFILALILLLGIAAFGWPIKG